MPESEMKKPRSSAFRASSDAGDAAFPHRLAEDLCRVVLRLACVDNEREARLARGLDMRLEALALRLAVGFVVVIIEAALADGDHTRVVCALD
jgi:hypothetical protein